MGSVTNRKPIVCTSGKNPMNIKKKESGNFQSMLAVKYNFLKKGGVHASTSEYEQHL